MKKILLAGLMLVSLLTSGQFIKGEKFIGGNLNLFHQEDSNLSNPMLTTTDFSVSARVGFLTSEKFAFGVGASLGSASRRYSYTTSFIDLSGNTVYRGVVDESASDSYSVELFGQRYFEITEKFLFSLGSILAFTKITDIITSYPQNGPVLKTPENSIRWRVSGGPSFLFFPTPKWSINAAIGTINYSYTYNKATLAYSNVFSVDYGSFTLGFAYYFRKPY